MREIQERGGQRLLAGIIQVIPGYDGDAVATNTMLSPTSPASATATATATATASRPARFVACFVAGDTTTVE